MIGMITIRRTMGVLFAVAILTGMEIATSSTTTTAFQYGSIITKTTNTISTNTIHTNIHNERRIGRRSSSILYMAGVPLINNWQITKNGNVVGIVSNHPSIEDGDVITTSPITNPEKASKQSLVVTETGSKYRLLEPKGGQPQPQPKQQQQQQQQQQPPKKQQSSSSPFSFGFTPKPKPPPQETEEETVNGSRTRLSNSGSVAAAKKKATPEPQRVVAPNLAKIKAQYQLTGDAIGKDGKYLLAGRPMKSTSGKSFIYKAYKNDSQGVPIGAPVTVKISPNVPVMEREAKNYSKIVNSGLLQRGGKFVKVFEFLRPIDMADSNKFNNQCALVMERGSMDLKKYLNEKGPFKGKELRDAAVNVARCVESLHTSGLVWTDIKSENFVVIDASDRGNTDNDIEDNISMTCVKGIDLESAMPVRDNPVDYSPEACPPEFAKAFLEGEGTDFQLQYNYDIWSLGMLFYELCTGRGYFDGKTPLQITKYLSKQQQFLELTPQQQQQRNNGGSNTDISTLAPLPDNYDPTIDPINLNDYTNIDERFKDLVNTCLAVDPKQRPNIAQILLHPYFLTTGIGPFSF